MPEESLENKAAEEKAAEEKLAAEKLAAENQKSEEEIAEEARLAKEDIVGTMQEELEALKKENQHLKTKEGRKKYEIMKSQQDEMLEKMESIISNQRQPAEKPLDLNEDDYMTVGSFKKLMQEQANEMRVESDNKARQDHLYGRAYEKEINNIGDTVDDEEIHLKVMKLVTEDGSPFNKMSSKDPKAAAQINYNKALRSLSGKSSPQPKLKSDTKLPPAGNPTVTKTRTAPEITITPEIQEYMNKTGMKEKEVKELMSK